MLEEKLQYRVKEGQHHGAQLQHNAGDVVELTEREAVGFLDKLELVEDPTAYDDPGYPQPEEGSASIEFSTPDVGIIEDVPISVMFKGYLLGVLNKAGFVTVGEVFDKSDEQLTDIKGISTKSLAKIRKAQSELGV